MKKFLSLLLCAALFLTMGAYAYTCPAMLINGSYFYPLTSPDVDLSGRPFIPLGETAAALGLTYSFDQTSQTAMIENGSAMAAINAGSSIAFIDRNGLLYSSSLSEFGTAYMKNGEIMVPLEFMLLMPDTSAFWYSSAQTIAINTTVATADCGFNEQPRSEWSKTFDFGEAALVPLPVTYYWQQRVLPSALFSHSAKVIDMLQSSSYSNSSVTAFLTDSWYTALAHGTQDRGKSLNRFTAEGIIKSAEGRAFTAAEIAAITDEAAALGFNENPAAVNLIRFPQKDGKTVVIIRPDETARTSDLMAKDMAVVTDGLSLRYYTAENIAGKTVLYEFSSEGSKRMIESDIGNASDEELSQKLLKAFSEQDFYKFGDISMRRDKIKIQSVSAASIPETENPPESAFDGSLSTRYSAVNFICTFDLGYVRHVSEIALAFWLYSERSTSYVLSVSADGKNYTTLYDGGSSLSQVYTFHSVNADVRYIRLRGYGSENNIWTNLLEIIPFENEYKALPIPSYETDSTRLPINGFTAVSVPEPDNSPDKAFDGDLDTRYAAINFDAVFDLGRLRTLDSVRLYFWQYDIRQTDYRLSVSADGESYITVYKGLSTAGSKYDTLKVGEKVRYIRVEGFGNTSDNGWTSLLELVPLGK